MSIHSSVTDRKLEISPLLAYSAKNVINTAAQTASEPMAHHESMVMSEQMMNIAMIMLK